MGKLEIDDVTMRFGDVVAVDRVSLTVAEGETVVLLGPSGCGKTTLLRLIAGFNRPTAGAIRIAGRTVASPTVMVPPEKRSLSMVFQSYAVWPHKTVFENLAYGLRLRHLDAAAITAKVNDALATVRMDAYGQRYPAELSGGQQQRVALARALVLEPEILLFDEPLSNLDATLREHMRFEIKTLLGKLKITCIYVTHDQSEAMVIADRVAVMNRGRIELLDPAAIHDGNAVGDHHRLALIMSYINAGDLELAEQRLDLKAHVLAQRRIEIAQGLVEQQDLRLEHKGACKRDALLLAARKLSRIARAISVHPHGRERVIDLGGDRGSVQVAQPQPIGEIFEDGLVRPHRVALEHHRERALLRRNHYGRRRHSPADDANGAGRRPVEARDQAQKRRLATAARTEQHHGFALGDRERDAVDRHHVAEAHRYVVDLELAHRYDSTGGRTPCQGDLAGATGLERPLGGRIIGSESDHAESDYPEQPMNINIAGDKTTATAGKPPFEVERLG